MTKDLFLNEINAFLTLEIASQFKSYYKHIKPKLTQLKLVSVYSICTDQEIEIIKQVIKPEIKQCYRNAQLAALYIKDMQYCEGRLNIENVLTTDHAFNKIRGCYIDITQELALERFEQDSIVLIEQIDEDELLSVQEETMSYCNIHQYLFNKTHKIKYPCYI